MIFLTKDLQCSLVKLLSMQILWYLSNWICVVDWFLITVLLRPASYLTLVLSSGQKWPLGEWQTNIWESWGQHKSHKNNLALFVSHQSTNRLTFEWYMLIFSFLKTQFSTADLTYFLRFVSTATESWQEGWIFHLRSIALLMTLNKIFV